VEDEVRPVTALFADIVGSTALGERLLPEEVKALVGECVTRISGAVEEFGGTVQAYQGDGICALFGVPAAHADDPERAARAALRILEIVGLYSEDIRVAWGIDRFNVRVGINSGPAAVGTVGVAAPQAVALGDTTNVAARLETVAEPGTVLVGDGTARLLERRFVLEERGPLAVKGRARPVRAWRLLHARPSDQSGTTTPTVGRDAELARLRTALAELARGRGQIILISGEDGLGKSRLVGELTREAGEIPCLEGHCPSYGGDALYRPFVEILREWLGVAEGDAEIAVRTKARARLGTLLGARLHELMPSFARLLGIKTESDVAVDVEAAYAEWIVALARRSPALLVVEDLQWADAATCDLAERLLALTEREALMLVFSYAPVTPSEATRLRLTVLSEYSHRASELTLTPLADEAADALARTFLPGLDAATTATLVARAAGNPFYLEELLRAVVEGSVVDRRRTWSLTVGSAELMPPALESLLLARIDRLPEGARRLAQVAAVVGRTFPVRVLQTAADTDDLDGDLTTLLRAEVVREVRRYPELECAFPHALLRQAALSTLTAGRRRELYGRVAAAFEELYVATLDDHLERLAHYYAQAEDRAKAIEYLERAARRLDALGAPEQAARLRERAPLGFNLETADVFRAWPHRRDPDQA
jgi:class 3 adenylate cyclase